MSNDPSKRGSWNTVAPTASGRSRASVILGAPPKLEEPQPEPKKEEASSSAQGGWKAARRPKAAILGNRSSLNVHGEPEPEPEEETLDVSDHYPHSPRKKI